MQEFCDICPAQESNTEKFTVKILKPEFTEPARKEICLAHQGTRHINYVIELTRIIYQTY